MATTRRSSKSNSEPWWVLESAETCSACSHGFAHRTEYYCFDCDRPVCPICIERTTALEFVCPACLGERDEATGAK